MRKQIDSIDVTPTCPLVAMMLQDEVNHCLPYQGDLAPRGKMMILYCHQAIDMDMALCMVMENNAREDNTIQGRLGVIIV